MPRLALSTSCLKLALWTACGPIWRRRQTASFWSGLLPTPTPGLRVSEALGLKWCDVDFLGAQILLNRAIVHQHPGEMKTEASQKPVPMDGVLLDALRDWSRQAQYQQKDDWVFASPYMDGKQPYWPETLLKCQGLNRYAVGDSAAVASA